MTLLGKKDGANATEGSSYLEIASIIKANGSTPQNDLIELWRRIVFNMAVSNTDDHLRNHGFLLSDEGWRLSPAYDINPNPAGYGLSLNISENDNSLNFETALKVISLFRISRSEAKEILQQISEVVSHWKTYASETGRSRSEVQEFETAFRWQ